MYFTSIKKKKKKEVDSLVKQVREICVLSVVTPEALWEKQPASCSPVSPGPLDPTTIFPFFAWAYSAHRVTVGTPDLPPDSRVLSAGQRGEITEPTAPGLPPQGEQATAIQEAHSLPGMAYGAFVNCVETWRESHRQFLPPQDPHMWNGVTPTLRASAAHRPPNLRRRTGAGREAVSISPSSDSPPAAAAQRGPSRPA